MKIDIISLIMYLTRNSTSIYSWW